MPKFRDDLLLQKTAQLTASIAEDHRLSYQLAMQGLPFAATYLCLGSGRCMYPRTGEDRRICAFCKCVEPGTQEKPEDIVRRFVGGN